MFDCTEEGELAARVVVVELAQHCPVRLAWSPAMHGAAFRGEENGLADQCRVGANPAVSC